MPIFEFYCEGCGNVFEELCASGQESAVCPQCGNELAKKTVSMPSPLKKGAFPFKPGPVHPAGRRMASGCAACGSKDGCNVQ